MQAHLVRENMEAGEGLAVVPVAGSRNFSRGRGSAAVRLCRVAFGMLAVVLVAVSANVPGAEAAASGIVGRIRRYHWEAKYELKSPDCVKKLMLTINGQSPGPSIVANQGDTIVVYVKNSLWTENLVIHWHGIRQIRTPWSDGTEGLTQCPILPGTIFEYQFVVDRAGSYMYHAHYGMQRESGLYGSIRVLAPAGSEPFSYDYDRSIILSDWYHKSTFEQAAGLSAIPFVWVGEPKSILIQGRGRFNCSSPTVEPGTCNATNPQCSPYVLTVVPGKTYRLRIASMASLSALSFQIQGHNLTVVEADGHYMEPIVVQNLFIYAGESYSVLLKADQDSSTNYWATASIVSRQPGTLPAVAVVNYYPNHLRRSPAGTAPDGPRWNHTAPRLAQSHAIKAHPAHISSPPAKADRLLVLLNTQNTYNGQRKWAVNNVSFHFPHVPYLISLKNPHLAASSFDQTSPPDRYAPADYDIYAVHKNTNTTTSSGIYRLEFNTTVDVVLQNANTMLLDNSETHPWHLHGHDFWVLGYGPGVFNESSDVRNFNLNNPIMKNTVPVHPYGWTAIRFKADNPGVWVFHCHIESHFYMGMGVVFEEGVDRVGKLPSSIMGCVPPKH